MRGGLCRASDSTVVSSFMSRCEARALVTTDLPLACRVAYVGPTPPAGHDTEVADTARPDGDPRDDREIRRTSHFVA